MWKSPLYVDKYQYARTNPFVVRMLGFLGAAATLFMAYGLWRYLQLKTWYLFVFGPIVLVFIANKLLRYIIQLFYRKFDVQKHLEFIDEFWSEHAEPTVNVFLPYAGEDLAVHEEVLKGVSGLNYGNYRVYMLDDAGSGGLRQLAQTYGFTYLSRPNKGQYKKSGNLQYGYDHSNGEYILILDADFIPHHDMLRELIPYLVTDKEIGILQTPQYFEQTDSVHKRSKIEFGGGNIVEDFYRVIMRCRDEFKAAMCVGTSAIYRRAAIKRLDGTPKVHASEDLATGLLITHSGYYVKYLPLVLSMGKSPDTYQGYFKQHLRWCSGNLVFARYWPTARLGLMARLVYIINPLYYFSEALTVIFSFQFLALLYFHGDSLSLAHSVYFLPYVVVSKVIVPLTKLNKNKVGTKLAALSNSYTYFYTYIRMLTKGVPTWQPTGVKTTTLHEDFVGAINIGASISSVYIVLFIMVILNRPEVFGNYHTYAVLGWSFYSVFWHVLFLSSALSYMYPIQAAETRDITAKAWVYAKTHSVLILFSGLVGSASISGASVLANPDTPTALAVSRWHDRENTVLRVAYVPVDAGQERMVLGAASMYERSHDYILPVEVGDTWSGLAYEAIGLFAEKEDVVLTDEEKRIASHHLAVSSSGDPLRPGEKVTFSYEALVSTLEIAVSSGRVH